MNGRRTMNLSSDEFQSEMRRHIAWGADVFYTEKGHFGIAQTNEAEVGAVVAVLGGMKHMCMLHEKGEPGTRWYEFIDLAYMHHLYHLEISRWLNSLEKFASSGLGELELQ